MSTASTGSRAGLITTLVIFVLLTFVAGGLYVSQYMDNEKLKAGEQAAKDTLALYAGSAEKDSAEIQEMLRNAKGANRRTVVSQIIDQRDEAIKIITGAVKPLAAAKDDNLKARDLVKARLDPLTITIDADSLTSALVATANAIPPYVEKLEKAKAALVELAESHKAEIAALQAQVLAKQDEVKKHVADVARLQQQLADAEKLAKDLNDSSKADAQQKINELGEEKQKINIELAAKVQAVEKLGKEIDTLKNIIVSRRAEVRVPIIRQPDGVITDVLSGGELITVNLGQGDGIMPGLTFEVYDSDGMPKAIKVEDEDKLPAGKASLEVIGVGPSGSQCRLVRKPPTGQILMKGDIIANLVYDRNVKWNFIVYNGDGFDLSNVNRFTSSGGEFLKMLIRKWGGNVIDFNVDMGRIDPSKPGGVRLPVQCDFIVMGKEPEIPPAGANDGPEQQFRREEKRKQNAAWYAVREAAIDLHIPILDQNRFLYLVGYFDQAKKTLQ